MGHEQEDSKIDSVSYSQLVSLIAAYREREPRDRELDGQDILHYVQIALYMLIQLDY